MQRLVARLDVRAAVLLLAVPLAVSDYQRSYPATVFSHDFGFSSGYEAWAITTGNAGYGIFGPYETDVPLSTKLCAWFHLSTDDATSDTAGIVRIDVANRNTALNTRYLQRQHFNAANTAQAFSVCFTSPSTSANIGMEYRAWVPGKPSRRQPRRV